jgi:hypothetical protein
MCCTASCTAYKASALPSTSKQSYKSRCSEELELQARDHGNWNNTWIHLSQLDSLKETSADPLIAGEKRKNQVKPIAIPVCTLLVESVAPSSSDLARAQDSISSLEQTWTSIKPVTAVTLSPELIPSR